MPDREKVINGLKCCLDERQADCAACYQQGPGFGIACRKGLMRDALKLLKEQEPQLLSYEEVDSPEPEIGLWLEDRGHKGDVMLVLYNGGVDEDMEFTDNAGEKHYRDSYDYGILWRCWTAKPTYEQRKAVKWDD